MSKERIRRSTPAAATMGERYLFQSWVRASEGGMVCEGKGRCCDCIEGAVCKGMEQVRWFEAEDGVRRSNIRRWESEETDERIEGECGENEVE